MAMENLFKLDRNGFPEVFVLGEIVVWDGESVLHETGSRQSRYPARSILKPFQLLACEVPESDWSARELSLFVTALGSITASEAQMEKLGAWLSASRFSQLVSNLKLPDTFPADTAHRAKLKSDGKKANWKFHTCCSKHVAILDACQRMGWDQASYQSEGHPYHAALMKTLTNLLGKPIGPKQFAVDGCGLPTPVLSLKQMAKLYQRLAVAASEEPLGKLKAAMLTHPTWIGGPGQIDTRLMEENDPHLIAKVGANGLLAISVLPSQKYPRGLGVILKLASATKCEWAGLAIAPILSALGLHSPARVPPGQQIRYAYQAFQKQSTLIDISPIISEDTAVFPGDVAFHRSISMDTAKGNHLTLSSLESTLHLGAHTDAPNHFQVSDRGIDSVELDKYSGLCQVIEVDKEPNTVIGREDVEEFPIRASRILFKTNSFPDPNHFNKDFVALSAEAVEYLAGSGVILVGIDTPSMDPAESKQLPAHHATSLSGMAILEGITLDGVEPGLYELTALPLRIEKADASPVRAVLKRI